MAEGATEVPADGREVDHNSDPCVRMRDDELVNMGAHAWQWEDLLKWRVCSTCGVRRPFIKRFGGQ